MGKNKKKGGRQSAASALKKNGAQKNSDRPRGGVRTRSQGGDVRGQHTDAAGNGRSNGSGALSGQMNSRPFGSVQQGMLRTSIAPAGAQAGGRQAAAGAAAVQRRESPKRPRAVQRPKAQAPAAAVKAQPKPRHYYDFYLFIGILMIFSMGLMMVYSSSQYAAVMDGESHDYYFNKQLIIGCISIVGVIICSVLSGIIIPLLKRFAYWIFGITVVLSLLTLLIGTASHGSTRWLNLGFISIQTAELVKIGMILFMAKVVSIYGFSVGRLKQAKWILPIMFISAGFIATENLSSGIIIAGIGFSMFFVGNRNWKWFILLGILGLCGLLFAKPLVVYMVDKLNIVSIDNMQYQLKRILAWACPDRFPDSAYQTIQGLYAIGSGGVLGQGLGESIQKFGSLPEAQNDMIFTIICEELGFIGAVAIVLMYAFIIYRLWDIANYAGDLFSSMVCVGIMAHISIQVILNIAVVTGVIPNTGVTLPFISYGGSAVLCTMAEMGIALAISHEIYTEC